MDETLALAFLNYSAEKLEQLAGRIEDCAGKLSLEQIWLRGGEQQNAVGNLILHLSGNVRQWIISAVGGQPDVRRRDAEFAARGEVGREELLARFRATVAEAVAVIRTVSPRRLAEIVDVQNYHITVMEAIYHVVEHFSQHTGQILFVTKLFTGQDLGYYRHLSAPARRETVP
ncbi:MAG TPA: DUF1572 family protein [Bryobacteraceae bacterium]|nr:DUF1572 family protein [Bryobacteraceae bacterium]